MGVFKKGGYLMNKKRNVEFYNLDIKKIKLDLSIDVDDNNLNIIQKKNRPFYLEIDVSSNYSAFIPIRTNLPHSNGFITKNYGKNKSGLDYSKAYIVNKKNSSDYQLSTSTISTSEFKKISNNQKLIAIEFKKFLFKINTLINTYQNLTVREKRIVDFSSLQYQKDFLSKCVDEIEKENKIVDLDKVNIHTNRTHEKPEKEVKAPIKKKEQSI